MTPSDDSCLFCGIAEGSIPATVVGQNEAALAFRDIHPIAPTHILIIPKSHLENAMSVADHDAPLIAKLFELAQNVAVSEKVDGSGFRLVMNVGDDAANSVGHLHMHLIGGKPLGQMG